MQPDRVFWQPVSVSATRAHPVLPVGFDTVCYEIDFGSESTSSALITTEVALPTIWLREDEILSCVVRRLANLTGSD
jgi:hypothetical protein